MYELIEVATKTSCGIFATCESAEKWIATHGSGNAEDYRITEW